MSDTNHVRLVGTVDEGPTAGTAGSGKKFATLQLVTESDDGKLKDRIPIKLWGHLAEDALSKVKPGMRVAVEGHLGSWQSKNGQFLNLELKVDKLGRPREDAPAYAPPLKPLPVDIYATRPRTVDQYEVKNERGDFEVPAQGWGQSDDDIPF